MKNLLTASVLAVALAACSSEPAKAPEQASEAATSSALPDETVSEAPLAAPTDGAAGARVLALEGLGDLRIGEAVPAGSSWAERGAQASDACRTVTSPDFPGVYAIVEKGKVRRITLGQRSEVRLVEGIGVGSSEADVKKWFAGFREEPHKYEPAPAKYLTAPNARSGDPALRFEIGQDGKVKLIHVGTMPVLGYVEGCS
ncbi:hypothetical protein [Novosphingobium sp. ST904]|uniref:hypothetical protein n=1 Tax=Novosphingobium sp. ST904 TaxID=1684385 RepID=UPI0006C899E0|nr:hypothetical protein [Novosphingobium sp. ST904]KPH65831.1 hypothetical protein ADT71_09950 [Novosphingobium sp. ST904]TCM29133.1 hypothetical protein EDF59_12869 [Novosphingobium sp. ST904]